MAILVVAPAWADTLSDGRQLVESGEYEAAVATLKRAIQERPVDAEPHELLAKAYEALFQIEESMAERKVAMTLRSTPTVKARPSIGPSELPPPFRSQANAPAPIVMTTVPPPPTPRASLLPPSPPAAAGGLPIVFHDPKGHFAFRIAKGWDVASGPDGSAFVKLTKGADGHPTAVMTIGLDPGITRQDLPKYLDVMVLEFRRHKEISLLARRSVKLGPLDGTWIETRSHTAKRVTRVITCVAPARTGGVYLVQAAASDHDMTRLLPAIQQVVRTFAPAP